jgi:hypothetical protein
MYNTNRTYPVAPELRCLIRPPGGLSRSLSSWPDSPTRVNELLALSLVHSPSAFVSPSTSLSSISASSTLNLSLLFDYPIASPVSQSSPTPELSLPAHKNHSPPSPKFKRPYLAASSSFQDGLLSTVSHFDIQQLESCRVSTSSSESPASIFQVENLDRTSCSEHRASDPIQVELSRSDLDQTSPSVLNDCTDHVFHEICSTSAESGASIVSEPRPAVSPSPFRRPFLLFESSTAFRDSRSTRTPADPPPTRLNPSSSYSLVTGPCPASYPRLQSHSCVSVNVSDTQRLECSRTTPSSPSSTRERVK